MIIFMFSYCKLGRKSYASISIVYDGDSSLRFPIIVA